MAAWDAGIRNGGTSDGPPGMRLERVMDRTTMLHFYSTLTDSSWKQSSMEAIFQKELD